MPKTIIIPTNSPDNRTGNVLHDLFKLINETENYEDSVIWDFHNVSFIHPLFIAPLSIYKYRSAVPIEISLPENTDLELFLKLISFDNPMGFISEEWAQETILPYKEYVFTPLSRFKIPSQQLQIQTIYEDVIRGQKGFNVRAIEPLSYILGELIDNMVDHSLAKFGFIFSQYSHDNKILDICLGDDGISLLGSFLREKKGLVLELNNNEAEIVKLATQGVSTKDRPYGQHRGFGLSSSKDMIVNGLGGEFYIISGNAFHQHTSRGETTSNMPYELAWPGTTILLRIPMEIPPKFNCYKYMR